MMGKRISVHLGGKSILLYSSKSRVTLTERDNNNWETSPGSTLTERHQRENPEEQIADYGC